MKGVGRVSPENYLKEINIVINHTERYSMKNNINWKWGLLISELHYKYPGKIALHGFHSADQHQT